MRARKGEALAILWAELRPEARADVERWAAGEALPEVDPASGVLGVGRYAAVVGEPAFIEVVELATTAAAAGPECRRLQEATSRAVGKAGGRATVAVYGQIFPPFDERLAAHPLPPALQIGRIGIPPQHEDEFNEWYNGEYLVGYLKVPGVYSARRYRAQGPGLPYLTVYELAHDAVSRQPDWDRARGQSIWRRRIERLWTHAPGSPGVYRRLAAR